MNTIIKKCEEQGIRPTPHRQIIASLIEASDDHPDAETLYKRAKDVDPSISLATIYRTLSLLEEKKIISKLEIGDGRARYEFVSKHHDHLVDVDTGDIFEFYDEELENLKKYIAEKMGFTLEGHRLELFGRKIKK